jgi:hypothetical protein
VEDRATRITNFINNIKLSTDIGALKVPTQSLLEQGLALPPNTCRFDCILTPATLSPEGELNGTDPYVSTICGVPSTTATMEEQALAWLVHDDPLQLVPDSAKHQFQLQQRYALLTLLLQHPFFLFDIANNSAPFHECEWTSGSFKGYVENCTSLSPRAAVTVLDSGEGCFLPGSTLSPDLGLLSDLVSFNVPLSGNLVGSLPETLARWSNLQNFGIEDGSLTGTIPAALGPAWGKTLDAFGVADNRLSGSLPDALRAWTNLRHFSVSGNQLTGTIPSALNDWSRARPQMLQMADFSDNRFTGSIPSEFCDDNGFNWPQYPSSEGSLGADCDRVTCPCCNNCNDDRV